MTTARIDRRIDILALRVTADLIAYATSEEVDPDLDLRHELREAIWETAQDTDTLGLDIFDPVIQTELTDRVRGLIEHVNS
jgi:hypothetical protein